MDFTARAIIVVTAAQQAAANAAAKVVDPDGGEFTFTVGLSPTGDEPFTAYWCCWQMTPAQRTQLAAEFAARGVTPEIRDLEHYDVERAATKSDDVLRDRNLETLRIREPEPEPERR